MNQVPIIISKINMPQPRKDSILRKEIAYKMQLSKEYKVTVLKAQAGSGKTTLLSQCFRKEKVSYLVVDETLNQVFVFWKYMFHLLTPYCANKNQKELFVESISMDILWNQIYFLVGQLGGMEECYLLLDDFQWIEDENVIDTLNYFIEHVSNNMHVIIATRNTPKLYLGTLIMEGKVQILEENEFVFSKEEAYDFLTHTLKLQKEKEELEEIIAQSNGWVGGMQLLAMSLHNSSHLRGKDSFSQQIVWDYVNQEIYQSLDEVEQTFLMESGLLDSFDEEICKRLFPKLSFEGMIEQLLAKNMFLIHADDAKKQYHYHSILKDFLLHLWEEKDKEKYCAKVGKIYEELGEMEAAMRFYLMAKEYKTLIDLLVTLPQDAVTMYYIMKIPLEEIHQNVDFAFQYFFSFYILMDMEKCKKIYEYIMKNVESKNILTAFMDSNLFFDIDWEYKRVTIFKKEQIEMLPLKDVTKAYIYIKDAYFLFLEDRFLEALSYLDAAIIHYRKTHNIYIYVYVLIEKAQIYEDMGHFKEAHGIYKILHPVVHKIHALESSYYVGLSGLYIRQMNLVRAKECLEQANLYIKSDQENITSAYNYTLAEWYYVSNQAEKTQELLLSIFQNKLYDSIFFKARILRYPIYRHQNLEVADSFYQEYMNADEILKNMDTEILYIGILLERKETKLALEKIQLLLKKAKKEQNYLKITESALLKAKILYQMKSEIRAITDCIAEAVSYAFKEEIRHPFWFEKDFIMQLSVLYKQQLESKLTKEMSLFLEDTLQEVITIEETTQKQEAEIDKKIQNPYTLTEREMDVMELLEQGNTNKQIGEILCISLATVKTHILNIYGKLQVNNRVAAVQKMRMDRIKESS